MRGFLQDRVRAGGRDFLPRADFYGAYAAWCAVNGFQSMSASRFYENFAQAGTEVFNFPVVMTQNKGARGYRGIVIK